MSQWALLRRHLHKYPELSGQESVTAEYILEQFAQFNPDRTYIGVGGEGLAFCFDAKAPGPNVLFRSELDALPIQEENNFLHRSVNHGVSHKCGHDGHMAILMALAEIVVQNLPCKGSVTFLFQPAEETGEGAIAVVADTQFEQFNPDYCFALHNLPGHPLGDVLIREGGFNCASRGMIINLEGRTAHAAYPETGISPALALADLMQSLPALAASLQSDELIMLTLIHCSMGEEAFGTAAGAGKLLVTLRSETNQGMQLLIDNVTQKVEQLAARNKLSVNIEWQDVFNASVNDAKCAQHVADAAAHCGNKVVWLDEPLRWSEDFGALSQSAKGAMFAFGAGIDSPQIHNPDYDFPDELINQGRDIFFKIYTDLLLEQKE